MAGSLTEVGRVIQLILSRAHRFRPAATVGLDRIALASGAKRVARVYPAARGVDVIWRCACAVGVARARGESIRHWD